MCFAVAAILVTVGSAWFADHRVRAALTSEAEARLLRVATTAASQISPESIAAIQGSGEESAEYLSAQVPLVTLRSATGVANASLIDASHRTLVDARAPEGTEGLPTALDSLAGRELATALGGRPAVSRPFRHAGQWLRAGFAPLGPAGMAPVGAVAIEAEATDVPLLADLARGLWLIALMSGIAIAVLAGLIIRASISAARLERRLSRSESLAAMGRLTATLAHEINNPLAIIRGSAERLRRDEPASRRMADSVIEEVDRLSRTLRRYLQFAKGGEVTAGSGDAIVALDATLALLEGELVARRVTFERRGEAIAAPVSLDNESLKQVYLNLMLNAIEAMPEGGRLVIATIERGGGYEVSIADDGPGIAPEVLKRLGSPFFTTKAQGSGLGLFLARRLAQAAAGDLTIESESGRGTICTLRLPRRKG